jgi:uncharacterized membrane protein YgdD (TMEM256/DUF423 family)
MIKTKSLIIVSGILGFLAVSLGAFGAHILKDKISADLLSVFQTGILYHLIHTVVVLVIAINADNRFFKAAIFMISGIVLFSFSLYIYSVTQIKIFAMITPFGGVSFLIGWLLIVIEGVKLKIRS